MSSYQQINIKPEFTTSNTAIMDIPMFPAMHDAIMDIPIVPAKHEAAMGINTVPVKPEAVMDIHMAPVKHEKAAIDIYKIPVHREAVVTEHVISGPQSLTKKQKLALKWHFGNHRYITNPNQLHFLFEQFPLSYSKRDKQLLTKAMNEGGKLRGHKHDILAGKNSSRSPPRLGKFTADKRQAKQQSATRSGTGANSVPQGIRKKHARAHNVEAGANKNLAKSIGSDGAIPAAPRSTPDPAFETMLETLSAMCID